VRGVHGQRGLADPAIPSIAEITTVPACAPAPPAMTASRSSSFSRPVKCPGAAGSCLGTTGAGATCDALPPAGAPSSPGKAAAGALWPDKMR
jgi:hypothetical protein